jgi:hypothetical protein
MGLWSYRPILEIHFITAIVDRGEVGSRLAAKVCSSRNSPCWQLSAVVHHQPVAFQHRRISRVLI